MRRFAVLALVAVLAACSDEDPDASTGTTSSSTTTETTDEAPEPEALDFTADELREAAFGTAACIDDPACPIVLDVVDGGATIQVETSLFRDSDAEVPGLALCVAATGLTDERVQVLGTDGGVVASGRAGGIPICDSDI